MQAETFHTIQSSFYALGEVLTESLHADEYMSLSLAAEDTFYLRLNQGKIRHAFTVEQGDLTLRFLKNQRYITHTLPFHKDNAGNATRALAQLKECRLLAEQLPSDPFCPVLKPINQPSYKEEHPACLPEPEQWTEQLLPLFRDNLADCVGLLTSGKVIRATYDSRGQHRWFTRNSFDMNFSFYTPNQKAVKFLHTGQTWDPPKVKRELDSLCQQLVVLDHHPYEIQPGKYRTYFAPQAVADLISMFSWYGLGAAAYQQGKSAFRLLAEGHHLSSKVDLAEDFSLGLSPRFNSLGEISPPDVNLIEAGYLKNWLTSTRTAQEYGMTSHYAEENEGLRSARLGPGTLPQDKILEALGTGLYINNVHYLNWSDMNTGRLTGMTRYACFWVENGKIKAPIQDLRFDESLYHFLGAGLVDLTDTTHIIAETSTYEQRSLGGACVPGILVNDFNYTL